MIWKLATCMLWMPAEIPILWSGLPCRRAQRAVGHHLGLFITEVVHADSAEAATRFPSNSSRLLAPDLV